MSARPSPLRSATEMILNVCCGTCGSVTPRVNPVAENSQTEFSPVCVLRQKMSA